MNKTLLICLLISYPISVVAQESIVFSGYPISGVTSSADSTSQRAISGDEATEYRVLIVKIGNRYFWASRENKELFHFQSGIAHWFISESSGYIKIIDPSLVDGAEPTSQFVYMEHLTLVLNTITYWGVGSQLNP